LFHLLCTELFKNVSEFQKEVRILLEPVDESQSIPELEVLQKSLERGATFGIDLPEIGRLKLVSLITLLVLTFIFGIRTVYNFASLNFFYLSF
jgi:hypothetical protein